MGTTHWSDSHYAERAMLRASTGEKVFGYDSAVRAKPASERTAHAKLSPKDVKVRESRDSATHEESHAVAVIMDVTGSMHTVPGILQENLPKLMGLLIKKNYLKHPQILTGAIGDNRAGSSAPLQVGQFESGIEIEEDISKLYLEGGGGGGLEESYELAMYFMAKHTSIDCFEKRNKRGYLFFIGDEKPYQTVNAKEVKEIIGDSIQSDLKTADLMEELKKTYDVYYIMPNLTSHYKEAGIKHHWEGLIGQNVLMLDDPAAICELIASAIGIAEGVVDNDSVESDLVAIGSDATKAKAVSKALATVAAKGSDVTVPDSGAGSGLAKL